MRASSVVLWLFLSFSSVSSFHIASSLDPGFNKLLLGNTDPSSTYPGCKVRWVTIAGESNIILSEPKDVIKGLCLLLPGFLIHPAEYNSYRDILVRKGFAVISFHTSARMSHRCFAQLGVRICQAYLAKRLSHLRQEYSVVGHSLGAKIGLLMAAREDPKSVRTVIALDPVDQNPVELTPEKIKRKTPAIKTPQISLKTTLANIYMVWAAASVSNSIQKERNARSIYVAHRPKAIRFATHRDASHFAYTDTGCGLLGATIRGGTAQGNKAAHAYAEKMVKMYIA